MQQQQASPYTAGQYFKGLTILCYALVGGVVVFTGIITALPASGSAGHGGRGSIGDDTTLTTIFISIAVIISLCSVAASFVMFNKNVAAAKEKNNLKEMLNAYRAAVIMRYALMEGPALFAVIVYFLTGKFSILPLVGLILAIMVYAVPTRQKLITDLDLSSQQADIINDDDALIE